MSVARSTATPTGPLPTLTVGQGVLPRPVVVDALHVVPSITDTVLPGVAVALERVRRVDRVRRLVYSDAERVGLQRDRQRAGVASGCDGGVAGGRVEHRDGAYAGEVLAAADVYGMGGLVDRGCEGAIGECRGDRLAAAAPDGRVAVAASITVSALSFVET